MSAIEDVKVPNIGDFSEVEVIEVLVKVGDTVAVDDSLITLETEKASMEIPSPDAGIIESILIKAGDKISEGDVIFKIKKNTSKLEDAQTDTQASPVMRDESKSVEPEPSHSEDKIDSSIPQSSDSIHIVSVPETDDFKDVTVIEILVNPGDTLEKDQSLIAVESEKASLELPSPVSGIVEEIFVNVGQKANAGEKILSIRVQSKETVVKPAVQKKAPQELETVKPTTLSEDRPSFDTQQASSAHAGPASRKLARVLGVDLTQVRGSGLKGRVLTQDIEKYVKDYLQKKPEKTTGSGIPSIPEQDFSQFGDTEEKPLSRIKKLTARNMSRNWLNIPHVTQFDDADITELENFRKENKQAAQENGISLTPLSFIIKAVVSALKEFEQFNASLSGDGERLIYKRYYHIGVAVDTPNGLLVPVIKNADQKGLFEIAKEIGLLSMKAKKGELKAAEMQGNTFTISSLGIMGGMQFTPIINAPDVAILGVSRLDTKPVWKDGQFVPRKMLPLALSYDHRVIDGVEGAKFMAHICSKLQDIRKLLL